MRINPFVYGFLVLAVFMGTILGFQATGFWSVSGKVTASGEKVQPSADDINTIKGWMTLEQVTTTFNVPMEELLREFDLPVDTPPTTPIKDLETETFSVTTLRTWLQSRTMPVQPEDKTRNNPSPEVPVSTLLPTSQLTPQPENAVFLDTPTVSTPVLETSINLAPHSPTEYVIPDKTVTGKTTFQQIIDWGVPKQAIQAILGGDLPSFSTPVKDFASSKGLDFPTIKFALQAEVDQVK